LLGGRSREDELLPRAGPQVAAHPSNEVERLGAGEVVLVEGVVEHMYAQHAADHERVARLVRAQFDDLMDPALERSRSLLDASR
jgi:hypothetical protein